jgi:hypothetical protein
MMAVAGSLPPVSNRNGGYTSVINEMYAWPAGEPGSPSTDEPIHHRLYALFAQPTP